MLAEYYEIKLSEGRVRERQLKEKLIIRELQREELLRIHSIAKNQRDSICNKIQSIAAHALGIEK